MSDRRLSRLASLVGLGLLAGSGLILHRQFRELDLGLIWSSVLALPLPQLGLAIGCTLGAYLTIIGYDVVALRYIDERLAWRRLLLASFVSGAFSNALSIPLVGIGGARLRFYAAWGFSGAHVGQIVGFIGISSWMGLLLVSGTAFLFAPPAPPPGLAVDADVWTTLFRGLGAAFLAVVALVVGTCVAHASLRIRGREVPLPRGDLALGQLTLGAGEWVLQGLLVYALLLGSEGLTLAWFMSAFWAAMFVAMLGHIPAGLGILDSGMLLLLTPRIPQEELLAALILFRVIYHLGPLALAAALLGGFEIVQRCANRPAAAAPPSGRRRRSRSATCAPEACARARRASLAARQDRPDGRAPWP